MSMHDEPPPPSPTELRWFGLLLLAAALLLAGVLVWRFEAWNTARVAVAIGTAVAVLYYVARPLRVPLFLLWRGLTAPVGRVVSQLVLAVIYFGLITPVGLAMRLLGRDALGLRATRESYWSERDTRFDPERYFRQS